MTRFVLAILVGLLCTGCVGAASSGLPDVVPSPRRTVEPATPAPVPSLVVRRGSPVDYEIVERMNELSRDTGLCMGYQHPEINGDAVERQARALLADAGGGAGLLDDPSFYVGSSRLDAAVAFGATELLVPESGAYGGWIIRPSSGEAEAGVPAGLPVAYRLYHMVVDGRDVYVLLGGVIGPTPCRGDGT